MGDRGVLPLWALPAAPLDAGGHGVHCELLHHGGEPACLQCGFGLVAIGYHRLAGKGFDALTSPPCSGLMRNRF